MTLSASAWSLVLTLATLRHEVSLHILREDSALHATYKDTILNSSALPTVMGGSNDPGMEAAKRVNEWPGEAQTWEYSMTEGDFEFDNHFEGLNMAEDITITRPIPHGSHIRGPV